MCVQWANSGDPDDRSRQRDPEAGSDCVCCGFPFDCRRCLTELFKQFMIWLIPRAVCNFCDLCMSTLGLGCCCLPIVQPAVWAWDRWRIRWHLELKKVAQFAVGCAWQCVQFWTPLSLTFLVLWLLYCPNRFHPRVDGAALAALDLTHVNSTASILHYDLSVSLSFKNSHKRLSIRYLDVSATAFYMYNDTRLGPADNSLPSFRQGPKNTTVLHPEFRGVVTVGSGVAAELEKEQAAGEVHLKVGVDLTLMYKVWFVDQVVFYKFDCCLWFSAPSKAARSVFDSDRGTQCSRV